MSPSSYDPYSSHPPTYIITKEGLKSTEEIETEELARLQKPKKTNLWLQLALMGALLAWFFNSKDWYQAIEKYLERRQKIIALEPYRIWTQNHPMNYDEVAPSPASFTGKAIAWNIKILSEGQFAYEGNPTKILALINDPSAPIQLSPEGSSAILGRIEGSQSDWPLIKLLDSTIASPKN